MPKTKERPLTKTEQDVLNAMSETEWRFPPPRRENTCWNLKDRGLLESELQLHSQNFAKKTAQFKTAFRKLAK